MPVVLVNTVWHVKGRFCCASLGLVVIYLRDGLIKRKISTPHSIYRTRLGCVNLGRLRLCPINPTRRPSRFAGSPASQREGPLDLLVPSSALPGMVLLVRINRTLSRSAQIHTT